MFFKKTDFDEIVKKVDNINTSDTSNQHTQKLVNLKIKQMIMALLNIFLFKNLIN